MNETATIPKAEYDRLCALEEELADTHMQAALARASGVNRVQIVEIEAGRSSGSVQTLRKLADALGVAVDDVIPAADDRTRQNKDVAR